MRAARVFRDDANLTAIGGLRAGVRAALDSSGYFILVAGPDSAASAWVDWELGYWLDRHPVETVLLAVSGGDVRWDPARNDFDAAQTT